MRDHSRALLRAGNCGKPALPALLGRGTKLAGPSGYWVGHSSGSFAVGLLSVREPSLAARLPRIYLAKASIRVTAGKGEGDYQGATSHAADRFSSHQTGRSALRVVALWALFSFPFALPDCQFSFYQFSPRRALRYSVLRDRFEKGTRCCGEPGASAPGGQPSTAAAVSSEG